MAGDSTAATAFLRQEGERSDEVLELKVNRASDSRFRCLREKAPFDGLVKAVKRAEKVAVVPGDLEQAGDGVEGEHKRDAAHDVPPELDRGRRRGAVAEARSPRRSMRRA